MNLDQLRSRLRAHLKIPEYTVTHDKTEKERENLKPGDKAQTIIRKGDYSVTVITVDWLAWQRDTKIQHAFPYLDATQREFLMTHMIPEEQDNFYRSFNEDEK